VALSDAQIQALARDALQRAAAGDFISAEPVFAEIAEARPNSGQALHLLGQARLKLGRFAEAREPLERAAKFLPRDPSAQINLAGCLSELGAHEEALAALDRAQRLKPGDAAIAHNKGLALDALGRRNEAEHAYDEALSINPRLLPSLAARSALLAARSDWMAALADLDMALTERPGDAQLLMRRGELFLAQGDWLRGLDDYEARLDLPGRWRPDLPRWQGESLSGRLLLYPEQADIDRDDAARDSLMLARGVEATVQCSEKVAEWLEAPTIRRGDSLQGFVAAAPLRSLPRILGWSLRSLPPPQEVRLKAQSGDRVGWFARTGPPAGLAIERDPSRLAACKLAVGGDVPATHLAALMGIPTILLLEPTADWLWGPQSGPSPWYPSLEVLRDASSEALAARLARC